MYGQCEVRMSRSQRTRPPARGGDNATSFIVCASLALAVAMAFAAMSFAPEQPMREPSMKVSQPIDFDVLEQGASIADLERGRSYYVQLCLPCHGTSGRGDGEWAYRMTPRPADLTGRRTSGRSEEALRAAISDGIPGTAMRGWEDRLSETQIRQVLGYVQHLGRIESCAGLVPVSAVADIGTRVVEPAASVRARDGTRSRGLVVLRFLVLSVIHLFIGTVQGVLQTFPGIAQWDSGSRPAGHLIDPLAHAHINLVGGVTMGMMGLIYYVLPKVLGRDVYSPALAGASFWLSTVGVLGFFFSLVALGIVEGNMIHGGMTYSEALAVVGGHSPHPDHHHCLPDGVRLLGVHHQRPDDRDAETRRLTCTV